MKASEAAELLTYAAAFDRRTIGDGDVIAWRAALDGLDIERCKAAVITHYRRSTDYLQPAHIWALARATTPGDVDPALRQHCEQGTYCDECSGVHHRDEPCAVLEAPPDNVREITSGARREAFRRLELVAGPSPLAQLVPMPDGPLDIARCRCGAAFTDDEAGHEAHRVVFGHSPTTSATG